MAALIKTMYLYGNAEACCNARLVLENLPQVKRLDVASPSAIRLFLSSPLHEKSLIPLLAQSGISGFRLI